MMNKVLFIYLMTLNVLTAFGQCCPYINEVTVYPTNPTTIDSIYVVTNVTTPNVGNYLGYTTSQNGNNITLEGCYYSGLLTQWQTYVDSINLGVMTDGTYNLDFIAYQSSEYANCDYADSNDFRTNFIVSQHLSFVDLETPKEIVCFPNPISNQVLTVKAPEKLQSIEVLNVAGTVVLLLEDLNKPLVTIDFSAIQPGQYFIRTYSTTSVHSSQVFKY